MEISNINYIQQQREHYNKVVLVRQSNIYDDVFDWHVFSNNIILKYDNKHREDIIIVIDNLEIHDVCIVNKVLIVTCTK